MTDGNPSYDISFLDLVDLQLIYLQRGDIRRGNKYRSEVKLKLKLASSQVNKAKSERLGISGPVLRAPTNTETPVENKYESCSWHPGRD